MGGATRAPYLGTRLSPPRRVVGSNSKMEEMSLPSGTETREYTIFSWAFRSLLREASWSGSTWGRKATSQGGCAPVPPRPQPCMGHRSRKRRRHCVSFGGRSARISARSHETGAGHPRWEQLRSPFLSGGDRNVSTVGASPPAHRWPGAE